MYKDGTGSIEQRRKKNDRRSTGQTVTAEIFRPKGIWKRFLLLFTRLMLTKK
jgi:hypothetical protein